MMPCRFFGVFLLLLPLFGFGCSNTDISDSVDQDVSFDTSTLHVVSSPSITVLSENVDQSDRVEDSDVASVLPPLEFTMAAGNFYFDPKEIIALPGQSITLVFHDEDGPHRFVMDELEIDAPVESGGSLTFIAPDVLGKYPYYCDIGAHRKLGMEGVLIVK